MRTYRGLILGGSIMLLAALMSLFFDSPFHARADASCNLSDCLVTDTALSEFVQGSFYATGLANIDDGAVQLLPMGLTSPWVTDTYRLPNPRVELAAVVYKDIIYALGGLQSTNFHSEIFSATTYITGPIKPSGWVTPTTMPTQMAGMSAVISPTQSGAILYVIGGYYQGPTTQPATSTISYHRLDSNGAFVGDWTNLYTALPNVVDVFPPEYGLYYAGAIVRNSNLYVIGGTSFGATVDSPYIYRFPILDSTGALGGVITETQQLPSNSGRYSAPVATWRDANGTDFLYVSGGVNAGTVRDRVPYTSFSTDSPNAFTNNDNDILPNVLTAHGMVQGNGKLFLTGGQQGVSRVPISQVHSALIDATGALHYWSGYSSDWIVTTPLPEPRTYHASAINSGGEVYVIGGWGDSGETDTIYRGSTSGFGNMYAPQGSYLSRVIDLGSLKNVTSINVGSTISTGVTMTVQYRYTTSDFVNPSTGWTDLPGGLHAGFNITTPFSVGPFSASKIQYRAFFTSNDITLTPSLNAFQVRYPPPPTPIPTATTTGTVPAPTPTTGPSRPEFLISGLSAPVESGAISRTIPYTVSNMALLSASAPRVNVVVKPKAPAAPSKFKIPPPPTPAKSLLNRANAPQTDPPEYLFYVSIYGFGTDLTLAPTTPISLTNAMSCIDTLNGGHDYSAGPYPPFIYWNPTFGSELTRTPRTFYAECWVPANTKNFYAQIDTCVYPGDSFCQTYGYVLEQSETSIPPVFTSNIIGPAAAGTTITKTVSGPGSDFLPLIRRQ